jgi:beta-galactosidase
MIKSITIPITGILLVCLLQAQAQRTDVLLHEGWYSVANDTNLHAYDGFEKAGFTPTGWTKVSVPHTWDQYEGYRRLRHGNRHGYAWYRKTVLLAQKETAKRYFLWFEGVGSYATVWLNGTKVGYHAGGRTSFTIDVTTVIKDGNQPNILAVRADHPANIQDLPWVCGGCSDERGFSEGSQPMGIFRPVHLIKTSELRIEPFGVHVWNDTTVSERSAKLHFTTTVKNYGTIRGGYTVRQRLKDHHKRIVAETEQAVGLGARGDRKAIKGELTVVNPHLWSLQDPYCYELVTEIVQDGRRVIDSVSTPYGIRWIQWPVGNVSGDKRFWLNGKPVFINGIAEYEHLLGQSHAFSAQQVLSRVRQMKAAGFNAFRDAHQPHNLLYQQILDTTGILWWTQMSAHIWYDSPEFRNNFKTLLKEWVIERRNSPSLVLWGLQNESKLPDDFARECTELIRSLDPTTSSQRKVTTCNGGGGTDWDVPQNWTGTYGGDPATYASDIKRQVLIGEYGAWRTIDLHTEGGFKQSGPLSEDRMTQLMELKVRLAESVKDSAAGHFFWLFTSHDNPGRVQSGEGLRDIDRIGPVNYKGLLTPWEEPLDVYYMFRANYASGKTSPMVYIVSHTWPGRWTGAGNKDGIVVYSNCDEVELFNDVEQVSLGKKTRNGTGTHFQWDGVPVQYNVLYAVGYIHGKKVAKDCIVLNHLPAAPHINALYAPVKNVTAPQAGYHYLYRVNCGGGDYTDVNGNTWLADVARRSFNEGGRTSKATDKYWGSVSWSAQFKGIPAFFASQRQTYDPISGTRDQSLFQTFRYGRQQLRYEFPVADGDYLVELYFTEPWLGTAGGMDCTGWRLFDVAINDKTVIKDLDIWKAVGHDGALRKTVTAHVTGGKLVISFPKVQAGQALVSAIAIASRNKKLVAAPPSPLVKDTTMMEPAYDLRPVTALRIATAVLTGAGIVKDTVNERASAIFKQAAGAQLDWTITPGVADMYSLTYRYYSGTNKPLKARMQLIAADGTIMKEELITFSYTRPGKWNYYTTSTGSMINAGKYMVRLIAEDAEGLSVSGLDVQ